MADATTPDGQARAMQLTASTRQLYGKSRKAFILLQVTHPRSPGTLQLEEVKASAVPRVTKRETEASSARGSVLRYARA